MDEFLLTCCRICGTSSVAMLLVATLLAMRIRSGVHHPLLRSTAWIAAGGSVLAGSAWLVGFMFLASDTGGAVGMTLLSRSTLPFVGVAVISILSLVQRPSDRLSPIKALREVFLTADRSSHVATAGSPLRLLKLGRHQLSGENVSPGRSLRMYALPEEVIRATPDLVRRLESGGTVDLQELLLHPVFDDCRLLEPLPVRSMRLNGAWHTLEILCDLPSSIDARDSFPELIAFARSLQRHPLFACVASYVLRFRFILRSETAHAEEVFLAFRTSELVKWERDKTPPANILRTLYRTGGLSILAVAASVK